MTNCVVVAMSRKPEHIVAVGQRFGRLTVTDPDAHKGRTEKRPWGQRAPVCLCDCGAVTQPAIWGLVNGQTRSCGCLHREEATRTGTENLRRYASSQANKDRLSAIWYSDTPGGARMRENLAKMHQSEVRKEAQRKAAQANTKHGMYKHPRYQCWVAMMYRCYNPKVSNWANYGGRGIEVYKPWHNAGTFLVWLDENLGPRPVGYSLDRIDNDGNYEPGNVRWADKHTQLGNKRTVASLQAQIDDLKRQLEGR